MTKDLISLHANAELSLLPKYILIFFLFVTDPSGIKRKMFSLCRRYKDEHGKIKLKIKYKHLLLKRLTAANPFVIILSPKSSI